VAARIVELPLIVRRVRLAEGLQFHDDAIFAGGDFGSDFIAEREYGRCRLDGREA
jgi:hypothetical protein